MLIIDTICDAIRTVSRPQLAPTLLLIALSISHLAPANAAASSNALSFSANYKANIKGFAVKASRELKILDNQQYQLSFRAKSWAATIDEVSTFALKDSVIEANTYHYTQTALGKTKERTLAFNRDKKTITSVDKGDSISIANSDHLALDKLNYQLQLQLDLRTDKPNLHYKIADRGSLQDYRFELQGDETLSTAVGDLHTVKIKVIRENTHKITYIWFAKDWDYLLVQLKQYEDDKQKLSITLDTATVNTIAVTGVPHNK
jgi:hypothetical protein